MRIEQIKEQYGWAEIAPDTAVVAGASGSWTLTYHAGFYGIDDGGVLKISWRFASDWVAPQFEDASAPNYAAVTTTAPATLTPVFERRRYVRPFMQSITIQVSDDSLSEGDTVTVMLGACECGSRAQTFCEDEFVFQVAVDWCGTGLFEEVPSPGVPVVSGAPDRLVVLGPSETTRDELTWVAVKCEDVWGNPCAGYEGEIWLDGRGVGGLPERYLFVARDRGVKRFEGLKPMREGVYRISAVDKENDMSAQGNALVCVAARREIQPFWGDLHGQSAETIGTNTVASYFKFARDAAMLDFAGHQGNDFQITKEIWSEIRKQINLIDEDGRFTALIGYEWSGNTPVGGDHNVYYPGDDGDILRSSHVLIGDKSDVDTDCRHITDLYARLKGQDVMLVPHVGGRYANLIWHDPSLEFVMEVCSAWGEFEWFLFDALKKGYKIGFTGGSDDHKGRPGASHPGSGAFGIYGGYVCLYARELTRMGIWEALRTRRCYATNGRRILVDFHVNGHPMGSEIEVDAPPELGVVVCGTAQIEKVDIFRGAEIVYTYPESIPRDENRVRIAWSGQRILARNRLARWDGGITLRDGRILGAEGFAFDSASEGIQSVTETEVTWTSVTTGDVDGVILTLDASKDAILRFETPVLSCAISLSEIATGPVVVDAGGVDLQVVFERMPSGAGTDVAFQFCEEKLDEGCHPYWVRVTQVDGGKAWVSPVYVNRQLAN
jgi:hypothetical protein